MAFRYGMYSLLAVLALWCYAGTARAADPQARHFLENRGQVTDRLGVPVGEVLYYSTGGDMDVFVLRDRISYIFKYVESIDYPKDDPRSELRNATVVRYRVDVTLPGGDFSSMRPEKTLTSYSHIYHGGEQPEGAEPFAHIGVLRAADVVPGVDFVLKVQDGKVKYDLDVKKKTSPSAFSLVYHGAQSLSVDRGGNLVVSTPLGTLVEDAPVTYRTASSKKSSAGAVLPSWWSVSGKTASLNVGGWDGEPVVIDPGIYFASYFGDSTSSAESSEFSEVVRDPDGNLLMAGYTFGSARFIRTAGAADTLIEGTESYLMKISPKGELLWATMYGGNQSDRASGVAVDKQGYVYITGTTQSDSIPRIAGTPVYQPALKTIPGNPVLADAFLARFQPNGRLLWGTYFGTTLAETSNDVAVVYSPGNPQPLIAFTGGTSMGPGGKLEPFDADPTPGSRLGQTEAYLAVFSPTGFLQTCKLLAGSGFENGRSIVGDLDGNYIVVGQTNSANFETAGTPFQAALAGDVDMFISRVRKNNSLSYSTYYGGAREEQPMHVVLDSTGGYSVVGTTYSGNFPTLRAFDDTFNGSGNADGFVVKMSASNVREWATYFGGDSTDMVYAAATLSDSTMWICGETSSPNFPLTFDRIQAGVKYPPPYPGMGQKSDFFFTHLSRTGDTLHSSVYGDTTTEAGRSIAVWESGNIAIGAQVQSLTLAKVGNRTYGALARRVHPYLMFYGCDISTNITPADDQQLCAGQSVVLNAGAGFAGYRWSNGATTQTITVSTSGSYSVTVRDGTGCEFTSAARRVTINPLPLAEITIAEGTRFLCGTGSKLTLYGPVGGDTYRWGRVNMSTVVGNDDTLVVQDGGRYILEVKSAAGCASYDTVIIERRLPANISIVGSTTVDFGSLDGCENTKEETFSLRNGSGEAVEVMSVVFDNPQFQCVSPLPLTIAGNGTQSIRVRFSPTGIGAVQSSMTITADPCGTVVTGEARGERTQASVSYSPSEMSFGESWLCSTVERDTAVVVRNTGGESLRLSGGAVPAFASIVTNFPVDIASGDSAEVVIRYRAVSAGASQGDVAIYYESGVCRDTLRTRVSISGADGVLSSAAGSVSFAPLVGCVTSSSSSFTLVNNTSYEIEVVSYTFGAGAGSAFSIPSPVGSVGRGVSAEVGIVFTPAGAGVSTDVLRVVYRIGECEKELSLDLRGELRGVDFAVSTPGGNDTLAFGTVITCSGPQILSAGLRLENLSAEGIDGTWTLTGVQAPFSVVGPATGSISAGASLDLQLRFTPTAPGVYAQDVVVRFEPCGIERRITLSGSSAKPELIISAAQLDFGVLKVGQSSTGTVTITNSGSAEMTVPITAINCVSAPFRVTSFSTPLPAVLQPGASLDISIVFEPTAAGDFTDSLCFAVSLPCPFRFSPLLLGRAEEEDIVVPDTLSFAEVAIPVNIVGDPTRKGLRVPIYLPRAERLASRTITGFRAVVEFDGSAFNPLGVSPGNIASDFVGRVRRAEITVPLATIPKQGDTIAYIVGDALLGSTRVTPIYIAEFEWQGAGAGDTIVTRAGIFTLTDICEEGGERLLDPFVGAVGIVSIAPNPSSGPVVVTISRYIRSGALLQVVDMTGKELHRHTFVAEDGDPDKVTKLERVNLDGLATGRYLIRLESAGEYSVREVSIVR